LDNISLDRLLEDASERRFWLKPIGLPGLDMPRIEAWTESEIEINFVSNTDGIAEGDILIAWRTGASNLIYVAERLPQSQWTTERDIFEPEILQRYPYYFKSKNLTPEFGGVWDRFGLRPFSLAREYNELHPDTDPIVLGALQHGADRLCIPRAFAEYLIRRIRAITPAAV
jgi:hypothetical protein